MIRHSPSTSAFAILLTVAVASSAVGQPAPVLPKKLKATTAPTFTRPDQAERTLRTDDESAHDTRNRLTNVLRQYPPSLTEVLRLDPSLLSNEAYLAPYPTLAAFLAQHPEVAHNPGFFIGEIRFNQNDPQRDRIRAWQETIIGFQVLIGIVTLIYVLGSILKSLVDYRRWLRVSKVQAEVHAKLLDRLTSNEDLMAYMKSPAGERFLESAPIPIDIGPRPMSAPIGRILWSVQAGFIGALAGLSLLYVSAHMAADPMGFSEAAPPLFLIGMLALAIGAGFILSAGVAYLLSHRLGLFERTAVTPHA
jgi:hypothetical protein